MLRSLSYFFLQPHFIRFGRNNEIPGKRISNISPTKHAAKNGKIPVKIVPNSTPPETPLMTKTLRPTGGVMNPISNTTTIITPYQMGLKPRALITGNIMGVVRIIMATQSIKQPRITYVNRMRKRMKYRFMESALMYSASDMGSMVTPRNLEKNSAPIMIKKIIAMVFPVSSTLSIIFDRLRFPFMNPSRKAPKAPTPAASVGVNTPA